MTQALTEESVLPTKEEKKKKETAPLAVKGMVAYADAGVRPNPGFGGIGIHGFVYNTSLLLKGVGLSSVVTSTHGYVPKEATQSLWGKEWSEKALKEALASGVKYQVMPEFYIDYYGTVTYPSTNNMGEIMAVCKAIELATHHSVSHLQIYTDSEHTVKGINGWLAKWAARNWTRADGTIISNIENWKETKRVYDFALSTGMTIKVDWVRGHNGDIGNELADLLATMGVFQSRQKKVVDEETLTPAEGYWKTTVDRHPFLSCQKLYFNTLSSASQPGIYYMGHHGKDDDMVGTRNSETQYCIARLSEPIAVIEMMRELQASYNGGGDMLYQLYLDRIFNSNHYKFLNTYSDIVVEPPSGYRRDLNFLNGPPLTREFKPAMLAHRVVDGITELDGILDLYLKKDPSLQIVNITDYIYDQSVKPLKKKEEGILPKILFTLKKEINVGAITLDVNIAHPFDESKLYELKLTLGLDILERNALKRLEESEPIVDLIIWKESVLVFRFATVIKANNDIGIWAAPFSNLRVIVPPRTEEEIEASIIKKKVKKIKVLTKV